jgi:hypothetical protein
MQTASSFASALAGQSSAPTLPATPMLRLHWLALALRMIALASQFSDLLCVPAHFAAIIFSVLWNTTAGCVLAFFRFIEKTHIDSPCIAGCGAARLKRYAGGFLYEMRNSSITQKGEMAPEFVARTPTAQRPKYLPSEAT